MIWKNFVSLVKIAPRRRMFASAIVYGLSLAVRFTSATGEEVEIPVQSVQSANSVTSVMKRDGASLPYAEWSVNAAEPILIRRRWFRPIGSTPSCSAP
ncbi:hypothetical protein XH89_09965 [Bradyrhizobium sp. CCBAU 53340]|nr:hypothetical protein XH89_09965 [Bradyrhizobium sp. CCBAU 53340]